jgi:hypothetical protein
LSQAQRLDPETISLAGTAGRGHSLGAGQ